MKGELNHRLRVADDIVAFLCWLLRRVSLLMIVLMPIGALFNLHKPDIGIQLAGGYLGLLLINGFFFGLQRFFRHWRKSVEQEWPEA